MRCFRISLYRLYRLLAAVPLTVAAVFGSLATELIDDGELDGNLLLFPALMYLVIYSTGAVVRGTHLSSS